MVREVVRDPMFLQRKSVEANMSDMMIAVDLLDTLKVPLHFLYLDSSKFHSYF